MKAHEYWSVGALLTMLGTFYSGYKGSKSSHKYFAASSLLCMIMAIYTGHKMISKNKKTKKEPISLSEIDKKYQELLETLSPEQEEVITEYCNAIFSSGADTEKFFYRLGLKDGLNLKNTVKSVLEMIS